MSDPADLIPDFAVEKAINSLHDIMVIAEVIRLSPDAKPSRKASLAFAIKALAAEITANLTNYEPTEKAAC